MTIKFRQLVVVSILCLQVRAGFENEAEIYHEPLGKYQDPMSPKEAANRECPDAIILDVQEKSSVKRWEKRTKSKRQTAIVGAPCKENIDCQSYDGAAFCGSKNKCECLSAYIKINGYCWPKRNPSEPCVHKEQCTAVSPNSYCSNTGICTCFNDREPTWTDDGPFCILPGECPTNGINPILRELGGADIHCETARNCRDQSVTSTTNAHEDAYYCLCPTADPRSPDCSAVFFESYCCPRRALACIQPRDEGVSSVGGGPSQNRWWYNTVSGSCESFPYRGSGGNGNNFQSEELCKTYCGTGCPRGNPSYTTSIRPSVQEPTRCSKKHSCPANYQCKEGRATYSICCPTSDFICSTRGGVATSIYETSPDPGDLSFNVPNVTRYYYSNGNCLSFIYYGSGGNFNNFQTEDECLEYCLPNKCKMGEPLRDRAGKMVPCSSGCPAKYTCTSDVCCPSVDFVCSLPQIVGSCSSANKRWWFNPGTRQCEQFIYSGCKGNLNNFKSYDDCIKYCGPSSTHITCPQGEAARDLNGGFVVCYDMDKLTSTHCPPDYFCHYDGNGYGCCPTRAKTCSIDHADPGTLCIIPVTRWYYNAHTRLCDIFTYNGCDGNSNNFPTEIDCRDYCGVGGCPDGGEPYRESYDGQYRTCGVGELDCPIGFACTIITSTNSARRNYCCPTRSRVCSLSMDAGQNCGTSTLTRYFFNVVTRKCETFTYNGCGGNRNNFGSFDRCSLYCSSAGCPPGQVSLQEKNKAGAMTCNVSVASSCGIAGYSCVFSDILQQGICCGNNAPTGSCPAGQTAYMDAFTNDPLQCQPNVDNSCPNGIFCQFSPFLQNSFCCFSEGATCLHGASLFTDPLTSQPIQCTPGLARVCPVGYTCQAALVHVGGIASTTGYCCQESNVCGFGYAPYFVNSQPVPCGLNQTTGSICPASSFCRHNFENGQSYCCVVAATIAVCPIGKQPYLTEGVPTLCTQAPSFTGCPIGYSCDFYQVTSSYYCCQFSTALSVQQPVAVCPVPYVPLQPIATCSPNVANSCPFNYFCLFNATGQRYVCCGPASVIPAPNPCPASRHPYVNPVTGQPQTCALGAALTGCPVSYGCAYSREFGNYYCCTVPRMRTFGLPRGADHDCPRGTTVYTYPGTRSALVCKPEGGSPCPVGYTCQRSIGANIYHCCSRRTGRPRRKLIGG